MNKLSIYSLYVVPQIVLFIVETTQDSIIWGVVKS